MGPGAPPGRAGTRGPGARDAERPTIVAVNDDELNCLYACALAWTAAPAPAIEAVRSTMRGRPGRIARMRALRAACRRHRPGAAASELPPAFATLATLEPHVRDAAVVTDVAGLPPESGAAVLGVPAPTVAARAHRARIAVAIAHVREAVPAVVSVT
jgi:DNA-directed RNA polymerase specialized sigma24 family protein